MFIQGLTAFDDANQRVVDEKLAPSVVSAVQRVCEEVTGRGGDITPCAYVQERLVIAGDMNDPRVVRESHLKATSVRGDSSCDRTILLA